MLPMKFFALCVLLLGTVAIQIIVTMAMVSIEVKALSLILLCCR